MTSKIAFFSLVAGWLFFAGLGLAAEQDYAARFKELQKLKADAQIDPLLDEWRAQKPNDPDAWITSANYYFNLALSPTVSTKPSERGDFDIVDKKTGKIAGSMSFKPHDALAKKAAQFLAEATKRFPNRLDIWCGLAYMHQERGDFESEFATLKSMVTYARDHSTELRWLKGAPLPAPRDEFLADKLHTYTLYYHKKDAKPFLKLATFAAEQFPNKVYAYNDVAALNADSGDDKGAREWLEKANLVAPKDTLVLMNLGRVCANLGDVASAGKYFGQVVTLEPNGKYAQQAKEALRKLKKK